MIVFIPLLLLIGFLLYALMRFYILPKRKMTFYSKHLKDLGYKVYQLPFTPLAAPYFDKYNSYFDSHGDSVYLEKNVFPGYDIVLSNVLDTVCLTVENLELVKKFYEPESVYNFVKHPSFSEGIKMSFGEGIFFSEKDAWKRKRKIISKSFNYDLLIKNIPIISEITQQTMVQLQRENDINESEDGSFQFEPRELGFRIFSRVMMRCFFESEFKDNMIDNVQSHKFLQSLFEDLNKLSGGILVILFGDLTYKLGLTESHRRFKQKLNILQGQISSLIEQKVQRIKDQQQLKQDQASSITPGNHSNTKNCDLIRKLLEERSKGEQSYDSKELLEEFCTFLLAGTDTTTNFLRSMIYYLCKFPKVQKKLRQEINEHVRSDQDLENIEVLKKLTYLECIQNEVIRMASPSASCFIRINDNDRAFQKIELKKGTGIFIEPFANHFNEKYFPSPHEFKPERWVQNKGSTVPYSYTGFFGGPRTCIGKHLAYLQSKISLIKLLKRYKSMQISLGGQRMEVKFLYGPQSYLLKVKK